MVVVVVVVVVVGMKWEAAVKGTTDSAGARMRRAVRMGKGGARESQWLEAPSGLAPHVRRALLIDLGKHVKGSRYVDSIHLACKRGWHG